MPWQAKTGLACAGRVAERSAEHPARWHRFSAPTGTFKWFTGHLDPRGVRVVALGFPPGRKAVNAPVTGERAIGTRYCKRVLAVLPRAVCVSILASGSMTWVSLV